MLFFSYFSYFTYFALLNKILAIKCTIINYEFMNEMRFPYYNILYHQFLFSNSSNLILYLNKLIIFKKHKQKIL